MKLAVRYQSYGGNTKAVAEVIANAAGVKAEPISIPLEGQIDILFVGGGVYKWDIDNSLKDYLMKLDPEIVKSVAAFSTAAVMNRANRIIRIVKERGINVHNETLPVKVGIRNHAWFGGKGNIELTEKQIGAVNSFVRKVTGQ